MTSSTQSLPEQTEDADAEGSPAGVHTSTTVSAPVDRVWQHLISSSGTEALLGDGVTLGSKGESWRCTDGSHGVVRSYHPMEQIRVSWHPRDDGPRSVIDLQLTPEGDGTRVDLYHEGEGIAEDGAGDKSRWDAALTRFTESLNT